MCKQPVSEYAPACPACGDPTAVRYGHAKGKPTNPWMIIGWIVLVVMLIPLATCVGILGSATGQ